MASPNVPNDFKALIVSVSGNLCAAFLRLLLRLPVLLWQLVNYMFTSTGTVSEAFLRDIEPPGKLFFSASPTAPTGYLLCNGAAVSRTEYPTLFTAIGVVWGEGDGSTTFNLPDYRGRMPIGVGQTTGLKDREGGDIGGSTYALGDTDGEEGVVLVSAELPDHEHKMFIDDTGPSPAVDLGASKHVFARGYLDNERSYRMTTKDEDETDVEPTVGPTGGVGSDTAHNNLPPYAACFVYVKT